MAVVINGTTGISTPDGTAGVPPYTGTSGTTNGLYFPTSTSAAIATNGTQALSISSAQVVALVNPLLGTSGGTGVNNGANTITIGGNFTMSGAYSFTGTLTGSTSVTFPTSGAIANTGKAIAMSIVFGG